jgi:hypothetical protein
LGRRRWRDDVAEAVFDPDAVAVERRQGVLEADTELADADVAGPLRVGLVLYQVLVSQATASIGNVPHAAVVLDDLSTVVTAEEGVLVEGVGDDLTQRVGR